MSNYPLPPYPSPARGEGRRNHGFTLIELAIVLVVIGLIVGGVLTGRDLIGAAAARAQISQIEKFNTAAATFQGKYGYLPGDIPVTSATQFGLTVGTAGCTGQQGGRDGNGLIDGYASPYTMVQGEGETVMFWQDLSTASLIDGAYPNGGAVIANCLGTAPTLTAATMSQYFPPAKIGNGNFVYVYENNSANWFGLSALTSTAAYGAVTSNQTISVLQAYNMDKKIDDGIPTTGRVQATYVTGYSPYIAQSPNAAADSAATCYNTATTPAAYSISYNNGAGANCALSFRMQAGD